MNLFTVPVTDGGVLIGDSWCPSPAMRSRRRAAR